VHLVILFYSSSFLWTIRVCKENNGNTETSHLSTSNWMNYSPHENLILMLLRSRLLALRMQVSARPPDFRTPHRQSLRVWVDSKLPCPIWRSIVDLPRNPLARRTVLYSSPANFCFCLVSIQYLLADILPWNMLLIRQGLWRSAGLNHHVDLRKLSGVSRRLFWKASIPEVNLKRWELTLCQHLHGL